MIEEAGEVARASDWQVADRQTDRQTDRKM